jgi:TPR repeat protein
MRLDILFRGAVTAVGAPILVFLWLGTGAHETGGPRARSLAPSSTSSVVPVERPLPRGQDARDLGLRLLTASDPDEVRAGLSLLTQSGDQGDPEAQTSLGRIYLQGIVTIKKDARRARAWFELASSRHQASADYFLGVMSLDGQGVTADAVAAARWFEAAAREGSPHAMFLLANASRAGVGVPRSDAAALALYATAGELEHPAALQALAVAYQRGELGLVPDEAESRRYAMEAEHAIKHAFPPP